MNTTIGYTLLPATHATAELRTRHRDYYLALVETATFVGPDAPRWRDVLRDEAANLRVAVAWALQTDPLVALRIIGAIGIEGSVVHRWDPIAVAELEAAATDAPADVAVRLFVALASFHGDLLRAEHHAERAVEVARRSGSTSLEAKALKTRGAVLITKAGFMYTPDSAAIADLSRALELARETGDRQVEGEALHFLYQPEEALRIFRDLGDDVWVAWAAWSASVARSMSGDLVAARAFAAESVAAGRASHEPNTESAALSGAGGVEKLAGNTGRARALYLDAVAVARRSAVEGAAATACLRLADLAAETGDDGDAVRWLKEALRDAMAAGERSTAEVAQAVTWLAVAASQRGHYAAAARLFGGSTALTRSIGQSTIDEWKDASTAAAYPIERFFSARERAQEDLGADEYERVAREGEALTRDQIVREALGV